jgi:hypothetical protein
MKNLRYILFAIGIFLTSNNAFSQNADSTKEETFLKLRKIMIRSMDSNANIDQFKNPNNMKFSSFKLVAKAHGQKIEFISSTASKIFIERRQPNLENEVNDRIKQQGLVFENECLVVFTVLEEWRDKKERTNNLEEELNQLYGSALDFSNVECLRIENPIMIYLLGSRH